MLEIVKNIAVEAGDFLLQNFGRVNSIVAKGDRNLATDLDRKVEEMVVSALSKKFPSFGILGEEQTKINTNNEYLWIIDPLDGTHNFIRNIDIFGISIGLWHKDKF
ncbi:inositol monophosphatase, partial [bacterium]